jgi:2-oxoglutarate dehydrogenase E2 component (dihydrolipoamide succinyltransferase)
MAKTDVIMPQMGESIAEGTVVKWLKKIGDAVKRDEPLFEISTDKVDAEIPAPSAGVLAEIKVPEGTTVAVNTVVGVIADSVAEVGDGDGKGRPAAATAAPAAPAPPQAPAPAAAVSKPAPPAPAPAAQVARPTAPPAPSAPAGPAAPRVSGHPTQAPAAAVAEYAAGAPVELPSPRGVASKDELRRTRSTPLVRRMAAEHGVDIAALQGTGLSGRVTKNDLLTALENGTARQAAPSAPGVAPQAPAPAPSGAPAPLPAAARTYHVAPYAPGDNVRVEPMSIMRRKIADHMVYSKATSPHVHTLYEVDCTNMLQTRQAVQPEFQQRYGQKLTITPFIVKAAVASLRHVPIVNASVDGDNVVYKNDINIGVAVALDWGLIVPVVKHADELTLAGLNTRVADLANRARAKQLQPDEVAGGTFTITNPGVFGALVGMPIISQPQVAILGVGKIEKRVKVLDGDVIAIRSCMYVSLGYDHRIVDGATADEFLSHLKETLETADFKAML